MATADNLAQAAYLSYDQMAILWTANTLRDNYETFLGQVSPLFKDGVPNDRPVGNWFVPMYGLLTQVEEATPETQDFFNAAVQYMYRLCYAAYEMNAQGLITNTQAQDLLTAWNDTFGT
jgi:hypothetical protein